MVRKRRSKLELERLRGLAVGGMKRFRSDLPRLPLPRLCYLPRSIRLLRETHTEGWGDFPPHGMSCGSIGVPLSAAGGVASRSFSSPLPPLRAVLIEGTPSVTVHADGIAHATTRRRAQAYIEALEATGEPVGRTGGSDGGITVEALNLIRFERLYCLSTLQY